MPKFDEVILKNKSWKLSWTGHHGAQVPHEIRIEHSGGFIDYATMYAHNGQVVYNNPTAIPIYIKAKVKATFHKGRK